MIYSKLYAVENLVRHLSVSTRQKQDVLVFDLLFKNISGFRSPSRFVCFISDNMVCCCSFGWSLRNISRKNKAMTGLIKSLFC